MEERTSDQIAKIYNHAGHSVTLINADDDFAAYQTANPTSSDTEAEWKAMIERNVKHLEIIKAYTEYSDNTKSIWTTEDFTAINAAITKGKTLYS